MTPFQVYKIYLAVKLHVTNKKYDIFEYRGAVKVTQIGFEKSRGAGRFYALAKYQLHEPKDAVQFFIANAAYDTDIFDNLESAEAHRKWVKNKEMMTQLILDDISKLTENVNDLDAVFEGEIPLAIKLLNRKEINIESLIALNSVMQFTSWSNWYNNLTYPKIALKLDKLQRFVTFNKERIMKEVNEYRLAQV